MLNASHDQFIIFRSDFNQITVLHKPTKNLAYQLNIGLPVYALDLINNSLILGLTSDLYKFDVVNRQLQSKISLASAPYSITHNRSFIIVGTYRGTVDLYDY